MNSSRMKAEGQSRLGSFVESLTNVAIGYVVAIISQLLIFPRFGIHVGLEENLAIGGWFTVVSIGRSFALRRLFNQIGNPREWVEGRRHG